MEPGEGSFAFHFNGIPVTFAELFRRDRVERDDGDCVLPSNRVTAHLCVQETQE